MKSGEVDEYISRFKELARQANFTTGSEETTNLFLKGLPGRVLADVLRAPQVTTYRDIKERAVQATNAGKILDQFLNKGNRPQNNRTAGYSPFNQNRGQRQPFFQQNRNSQGNQNQRPQYNSSNAPASMNNQAVPMDLGRARAPNWRNRGRGRFQGQRSYQPQGRVANAGTSNACFSCGQEGHFARNCPERRKGGINLIDFDSSEGTNNQEEPADRVSLIRAELANMSFEEKQQLAQGLTEGTDQEFPNV
jgi:hypothetical protein